MSRLPVWFVVFIVAIVVLCIIALFVISASRRKKRQAVMQEGKPIKAIDFLADWKSTYKDIDTPGCYVILTNPETKDNDVSYEGVYIGRSVHVFQQVRKHLAGQGNGDVYADVRAGKDVEVRIVPCSEVDLVAKKKELVAAFKATNYYNQRRS